LNEDHMANVVKFHLTSLRMYFAYTFLAVSRAPVSA